MIRLLIDSGVDIGSQDKHSEQGLHRASAHRDQPEVIEYLSSRGANIEAEVSHEFGAWRAIHLACIHEHVGNVRVLLALGANIDRGRSSQTPLELAIECGSKKSAAELLKISSDDVVGGPDGGRSFYLLANHIWPHKRGRRLRPTRLMFDLLLQPPHHADIQKKDQHGNTALHHLARVVHLSRRNNKSVEIAMELASRLINNGADIEAVNNAGETPLYTALMGSQTNLLSEMSDFLIASEAQLLLKKPKIIWSLQPFYKTEHDAHGLHFVDLVDMMDPDGCRRYDLSFDSVARQTIRKRAEEREDCQNGCSLCIEIKDSIQLVVSAESDADRLPFLKASTALYTPDFHLSPYSMS